MGIDLLPPGVIGNLLVSCQATAGSPLNDPVIITALAQAALLGGAGGLRINGAADIAAVRAVTQAPIIGLNKVWGERRFEITPSVPKALEVVAAGADIVAVEATHEVFGTSLSGFGEIIAALREQGVPVMADVSTVTEAVAAIELGATVVGTTLSGYTPQSPSNTQGPDFDLVAELVAAQIPVFAEGRFYTPQHMAKAFDLGALSVIVGGAITDPLVTTRRFIEVINHRERAHA